MFSCLCRSRAHQSFKHCPKQEHHATKQNTTRQQGRRVTHRALGEKHVRGCGEGQHRGHESNLDTQPRIHGVVKCSLCPRLCFCHGRKAYTTTEIMSHGRNKKTEEVTHSNAHEVGGLGATSPCGNQIAGTEPEDSRDRATTEHGHVSLSPPRRPAHLWDRTPQAPTECACIFCV